MVYNRQTKRERDHEKARNVNKRRRKLATDNQEHREKLRMKKPKDGRSKRGIELESKQEGNLVTGEEERRGKGESEHKS